jgi:hypothetical protein
MAHGVEISEPSEILKQIGEAMNSLQLAWRQSALAP